MDHHHHHGGSHPHHHHHTGREEEGYPPPPPFYGGNEFPPPFPPPPQVYHTSHTGPRPEAYPQPPPPVFAAFPPPPPHVERPHHHPHIPHVPPVVNHHTHHVDDELSSRPTVKMYCKAETNHCLSIRDGKVILARADPHDPFQHWIKDERFSTTVKDEEGYPSFALINKATRQAVKHSVGPTHPVQLIPYNPNLLDESILWCDKKLADGYYAIRMVNNIRLNMDAFHGDKNHGGVHDGSIIVLWEWKKGGDNQRWKIVPY